MVDATAAALDLLRLYGPLALCLFTFLETSMLFPFLPSEVVVPAAAALLVTGPTSLLVFVLAATVGGTVGAFLPFYVCYSPRIGARDWLRGPISVSDERIARGKTWFRRWGESSVLWGRFLPVLRSVISIPAGFAEMNPVRFGVFTAIGTTGFYAATGVLVYYGRRESVFEAAFAAAVDRPGLTALVALVLLGFVVAFGRRSARSG
ncbi:DedA family protein [Haloarcula nitratireducens]|uniref:DedA family protein n=1 Tax=Haloarcula nitratireducens TaxID=2487749 RepID=A0AAW4PEY2_9EURY|nr:DedA family protein [Halomicroarcula nitratireducens]MBX0296464.1 DedA family protein [Halomicroarcula nitratireducens]